MLSFQEEKEAAFKQGSLVVERYDDVLGKALENPEHPGRVRGVGGLVPMKKTYGKGSRRNKSTSSRSSAEFDARVDQRVEERLRGMKETIQEEMRAEMRAEMRSELELLLQQKLGQQEKTHTPTLLQSSSCQSVQPPTLSVVMGVMHTYSEFNLFSITCHTHYFIQVYLYRRQK